MHRCMACIGIARRNLAVTLVLGLLLATGMIKPAAGLPLVVGGFDIARGGDFSIADSTLFEMGVLRLVFEDIEPSVTFSSSNVLTAEYLATVDIVVLSAIRIPPNPISPLSSAEQSALFNFVAQGGRALIATEHILLNAGGAYESLLDPFGIETAGGITATATVVDPNHPIVNGPFGQITSVETAGSGYYTNLGPYATPLALLNGDPNMPMAAAIESNAIAPGSGRVIFIADGDIVNPFIVPQEQALVLVGNAVDYLVAVPEPNTMALISLGGALTLLAVRWRRTSAAIRARAPDRTES